MSSVLETPCYIEINKSCIEKYIKRASSGNAKTLLPWLHLGRQYKHSLRLSSSSSLSSLPRAVIYYFKNKKVFGLKGLRT